VVPLYGGGFSARNLARMIRLADYFSQTGGQVLKYKKVITQDLIMEFVTRTLCDYRQFKENTRRTGQAPTSKENAQMDQVQVFSECRNSELGIPRERQQYRPFQTK